MRQLKYDFLKLEDLTSSKYSEQEEMEQDSLGGFREEFTNDSCPPLLSTMTRCAKRKYQCSK